MGNTLGVAWPNGVQTAYTYDSLYHLTQVTHSRGGTLAGAKLITGHGTGGMSVVLAKRPCSWFAGTSPTSRPPNLLRRDRP